MNNQELQFLSMLDTHTSANFLGVFSFNTLPKIGKYPSALIVNNKPSSHIGEHWVAMYFNSSKKCIFFDSFGLPPFYYKFDKYIKRYSITHVFNDKTIQSIFSNYCGIYCIYFILCMTHDLNLIETISPFTKNYKGNDRLVFELVTKFLKNNV